MTNTLTIKNYISKGYNVLLHGLHGVGKTAMVRDACEQLGLKVAYYSVSTMDPWVDFVGIPIPTTDPATGKTTLVNVRPTKVDDAEVIIFDEYNRYTDTKVINATMEMIQFGTLNGEHLPNLKCIVAMINPATEGNYAVNEIDDAIMDRFDVMLEVSPEVTVSFLNSRIGDMEVARSFSTWWNQRQTAVTDGKEDYISPRRVTELATRYMENNKNFQVVIDGLPMGGVYDTGKLKDMLGVGVGLADIDSWYLNTEEPEAIRSRDTLAEDFPLLSPASRAKVVDALAPASAPGSSLTDAHVGVLNLLTTQESESLSSTWGLSKKALVQTKIKNTCPLHATLANSVGNIVIP